MKTADAANSHEPSHARSSGRGALDGLLSFLVTPTRDDETIDEARLCDHADDMIAHGVDGMALFGSTGAIGSFTEGERMRLAETLLRHVGGRVPVMIGTGAITTAEAVRLSRHAEQFGADAILVVPITYWLLNEAEIMTHYCTIAGSVGIDVCLYNNPRLTGVDMTPPILSRLADIGNVRYVKESSPELGRIPQIKRLAGDRLRILAGRDSTALDALRIGADCWTSGVANFAPAACVELMRRFRTGNPTEISELETRLAPVLEFCMTTGLVRSCHAALEIQGRSAGRPRQPIGTLPAEDMRQLERLLRDMDSLGISTQARTTAAA